MFTRTFSGTSFCSTKFWIKNTGESSIIYRWKFEISKPPMNGTERRKKDEFEIKIKSNENSSIFYIYLDSRTYLESRSLSYVTGGIRRLCYIHNNIHTTDQFDTHIICDTCFLHTKTTKYAWKSNNILYVIWHQNVFYSLGLQKAWVSNWYVVSDTSFI